MAIRSRRRSTISAIAPAGIASSITGKLSAASTSATIAGDEESDVINQPAPTSCIHEPTFETMVAIHRLRKSVFWSGLHGEVSTPEATAPADAAARDVFTGTPGRARPRPLQLRRWQQHRSSKLHHELVDVAPAPIFPTFERGDDRVLGRSEMLGSVLVLRLVAASDVPAGSTQPKVDPRVAHGEAFLAAAGVRHRRHDRAQMGAVRGHRNTPLRVHSLLSQ